MKRVESKLSFGLALAFMAMVGTHCSAPGEDGEENKNVVLDSTRASSKEDQADAEAAKPAPTPQTKIDADILFHTPSNADPATVAGYLYRGGKLEASKEFKDQSGGDFLFKITLPGSYRLVVTALEIETAQPLSLLIDPIEVDAGRTVVLSPKSMPKATTLTGRVSRAFVQGPFSGITVTMDGLPFSAVTDDQGHYELASVPPGVHHIRYIFGGFADGLLRGLEVQSEGHLELDEMFLINKVGNEAGSMTIYDTAPTDEGEHSIRLIVSPSIDATEMRVSDSSDLEGQPWQPLRTTLSKAFSGEGERSIFIQFKNPAGQESPVYAKTLYIGD